MERKLVWVLLGVSLLVGNLYKFSVFSPDVHISILDCAVFILTVVAILKDFRKYLADLNKFNSITVPILVFSSIAVVSLLLSWHIYGQIAVVVGAMYLFRWIIYSLFFLSLIQLIKVSYLPKLLIFLGLLTVAVGLVQYVIYPDVRSFQVAEWDPHYYRIVGTLLDPGFTGIILVFSFIYLTLKPLTNKFTHYLAWGGTYLALSLTYSRSSYLAFLAGVAWIAWKVKGWRYFFKMFALLIVTLLILPRASSGEGVKLERTNSIYARIENWQHALTIFADHPLMGVGFNTYRYAQKQYTFLTDNKWLKSHAGAGADSSLLFVAATTGILGLGGYLWYLHRLSGIKNIVLQTTLVALVVHSWFLNSLFYPAVMLWLAILITASEATVNDK